MDDQLTPEEIQTLMHEAGLVNPVTTAESAVIAKTVADHLTQELEALSKSALLETMGNDCHDLMDEMTRLRKRIAFLRQQISDFEHQAIRRN